MRSGTRSVENSLRKPDAECKKDQIEIPNMMKKMDRVKKMQCWVILKRIMIGRDGWAFKQPLDIKGLDKKIDLACNNYSSSTALKKKNNVVKQIGFVDIEYKLKKCLYSDSDEFARDMRHVFLCASLYPSRNEVHKVGRRVSKNFEISWKSLNDKWEEKGIE